MKKKSLSIIVQIIIILLSITSIVLINIYKDLSYLFIAILIINLFLAIRFNKISGKTLQTISCIIIGIVFIYSGFVKAVDPWGSMFKFQDYFEAFHMDFFNPFALYLGIVLSAFEFLLGVSLLFKINIRLSSFFVMLFMVFFTILTFYLALANPVADCGCFGDAIILTNWQTFYKNIILMVFTMLAFLNRNIIKSFINLLFRKVIIIIGLIAVFGVSIYALYHLPIIDFREWKVGNSMISNASETLVYLTYQNKQTGEEAEMLSNELPWQDTVWMANWKYKEQRYEEIGEADGSELKMTDEYGDDAKIHEHGYQFIVVSYYLEKTNETAFDKINKLNEKAEVEDISFIGVSGSVPDFINSFRQKHNILFPVHNADEIALKTVIRSNPGLLLLKDGVIIEKWGHRDIPNFEEIKLNYFD